MSKRHRFKPIPDKEGCYKCLDCLQEKNLSDLNFVEQCDKQMGYNKIYNTHHFKTYRANPILYKTFQAWLPDRVICDKCNYEISPFRQVEYTCDEWIIKNIIE